MTRNSDFKNLVRVRMSATGETYTAARSALMKLRAVNGAISAQPSSIGNTTADSQAEACRLKTLRTFMPDGTLTAIPTKRKALVVILLEILPAFDAARIYTEKEANAVLREFHPDFARLRRELIDYGYLTRNSHTGRYWVSDSLPERTATMAQEVGEFEAFLR